MKTLGPSAYKIIKKKFHRGSRKVININYKQNWSKNGSLGYTMSYWFGV